MERYAFVSGATSGIGRATAILLAERGYKLVLNSAHNQQAGEQLAREIGAVEYVKADLSDPDELSRCCEHVIKAVPYLDVLINNAGRTRVIAHNDLSSAAREVWREIFELNVFAPFELVAKLREHLERAEQACVVNVSSVAGHRATGSSIPYACSKAALSHMTELLAKVLGPKIRVNAVAPGLIDTPWTADWGPVREMVSNQAPLKRVGKPEDVAQAISCLIESTYVTGQVLLVDGGWSLVI